MPSSGSKAVFKAKSIMKTKSKVRISRGDRNKENSTGNAQFRHDIKPPRKPMSMLPKPSSRLSTSKNTRKGEFQKYANDNMNRDKSIPTKVLSRKGSVHTTSSKGAIREPASKTELLYQKARSALGKSKKNKNKNEFSKPPLKKRRSEAVLEVMRKQERIRKNLSQKGSFCQTSSRNIKSNLLDNNRKSIKNTQERLNKAKLSNKKSHVTVKNQDEANTDKHFKLNRKQARARIGLGSIPNEKIDEFIKVKKTKVKPQVIPEKSKPRNPIPIFSYECRSRSQMNKDPSLTTQNSHESNQVRVRETLKIKFPEAPQVEERKIATTIESRFENDLASSMNDFDEFTPMYSKTLKQKSKKSSSKPKNPKITKEKHNFKSFNTKASGGQEDQLRDSEDKKELVRQQRKANYKRVKEEKEKKKERDMKTKQNIEALNEKFK